MLTYRLLADLILLIWFRIAHLAAIGFVVVQAWWGAMCPLTIWENQLRASASQTTYPGDFIPYWIGQLLYYDAPAWVFTLGYTLFAALVVVTLILAPPRWPGHEEFRQD